MIIKIYIRKIKKYILFFVNSNILFMYFLILKFFDILFGIFFGILSGILFDILFDIFSGISAGILFGI
jgi:hypothetical protein